MRAKRKQAINFDEYPDCGIKTVYGRNITNSFPTHVHQSLTVGMIIQGKAFLITSKGTTTVIPGEMYIINPGEPHTIKPLEQNSYDYLTFCFANRLLKKNLPKPETNDNLHQTQSSLYFPFIKINDPELSNNLDSFYLFLRKKLPNYEKIIYADQIVQYLLKTYAQQGPIQETPNHDIIKVKNYIEQNPTTNMSLKELANIAHLSPYYFLRIFKKEVGVSPYHYQIQTRIKFSQKLLLERHPIAHVAQETGFVDQSHFTRFFQKIIGITPKEYIEHNVFQD